MTSYNPPSKVRTETNLVKMTKIIGGVNYNFYLIMSLFELLNNTERMQSRMIILKTKITNPKK